MASRPTSNDQRAWQLYWTDLGYSWRTEKEIDEQRQRFLQERLSLHGGSGEEFPFNGHALTRADIEWLIAHHHDPFGSGPVVWDDSAQRQRKGIDLRGAVLHQQNLSYLPLARMVGGVAIESTKSNNAKHGAALQCIACDLHHADLRGADLQGVILAGCQMQFCQLEEAILTHAIMQGANLARANLRSANLIAVNLSQALLWDAHLEQARLIDANLVEAELYQAHGEGANFARAHLQNANLMEAQLQNADLSGAQLQRAVLVGANLQLADFSGWHPPTLEAKNRLDQVTHLEYADLSLANLDGANLTDTYLEGAIFICASLQKTILVNAHLESTHLQMANLRYASLEYAHLSGGNLQYAHCEGANFKFAHFGGTIVSPESRPPFAAALDDTTRYLAPTDLRNVYFDSETLLSGASFTSLDTPKEVAHSTVTVADANWNGINLTVVDWKLLKCLGDEQLLTFSQTKGKKSERAYVQQQLLSAIRANRQLAVALESQGMNEDAQYFAYAAQNLQRKFLAQQVRQQRKVAAIGAYFFSWLLWSLAGYGYRMRRIVVAYLTIVLIFAGLYFLFDTNCLLLGTNVNSGFCASSSVSSRFISAILISVTAFHGRVFSSGFSTGSLLQGITAVEAIVGLVIEGVFIAMLTQRFFGK